MRERGRDRPVPIGRLVAIAVALTPLPAGAVEAVPPGAESCRACHRAGGATGLPDLSSLPAADIAAAMAAYRSGARPGTMMPRIAQGFSEAEARAVADALGRRP